MIPPEMELQKDILKIEDQLLAVMMKKKKEITRRVNSKTLRFQQVMEKRKIKDSSAFRMYQDKVFRKLR